MKILKKIIIAVSILLVVILSSISIYLYNSGPELTDSTNEVIQGVIADPLPELIKGKTGIVKSNGVDIWYENITPKDSVKGHILLIMGISNDALGWPPKFIDKFVNSGYGVIRYDHRGTGMSDWLKNWDSEQPYALVDMANDGIAVLDHLKIEKAHVIGVSMGGMIAQELVINHPKRVNSLTSMMSSGFISDPELPKISSEIAYDLIKVSLKYGIIGGEQNMIKLHLASRKILMGNANYNINVKELSEQVFYNIRKRKGYNSNVTNQHQAAVFLSGSRYDHLKNISIPTLIVHGKFDPFIPIEHGKKCSSIIPNSESLWVDNMGHDIPNELIDQICNRIIQLYTRT